MANERTAAADTRETLRNKLGALELSLFAIRSHRIMADDLLLQLLEIIVHFIWENVSIDYGRMVGMEDGEVSNPINIYFDRIFPSVPTNPSLATLLIQFPYVFAHFLLLLLKLICVEIEFSAAWHDDHLVLWPPCTLIDRSPGQLLIGCTHSKLVDHLVVDELQPPVQSSWRSLTISRTTKWTIAQ